MEILYVFPEPLPLRRARGIQVAHTVAALAESGIAVRLAYVPSAEGPDPLVSYGIRRPENVELVPLSRTMPAPFSWLPVHSNRLFFYRLRRWLEHETRHDRRPALIMARHLKIAHALLAQFPDIPLLYEAHEVFADVAPSDKRESLAHTEEAVLRRAAVLVAITKGVAEDLKKRYCLDRDIEVLPDAVVLPDRLPEKPWDEAGRHVVYAGSFFPWKGVQDLIAAAEWLPGCRFTLIGGSAERIREYQLQVPASGAEVIFTGHMSHRQTLEALGQTCIAVLPNRAEPNSLWSSPLKLFEYMAAGCAVVAADLPSVREILADHEAVWVPPGNPRELAAGIRRLANDPGLARQLGELVRERAKNYTWGKRAGRLAAIMRTLA